MGLCSSSAGGSAAGAAVSPTTENGLANGTGDKGSNPTGNAAAEVDALDLGEVREDGIPWLCTMTEFGRRGYAFARAVARCDAEEAARYSSAGAWAVERCKDLLGGAALSLGDVWVAGDHQYWVVYGPGDARFQLVFCGRLDGSREGFVTGLDPKPEGQFRDGAGERPDGKRLPSPSMERAGDTLGLIPVKDEASFGADFLEGGKPKAAPPLLPQPAEGDFADAGHIDMALSRVVALPAPGTRAVVQLMHQSYFQHLLSAPTVEPAPASVRVIHTPERSEAVVEWNHPVAAFLVRATYRFERASAGAGGVETESPHPAERPLGAPWRGAPAWDVACGEEELRKGFLARSHARAEGKGHGVDPEAEVVARSLQEDVASRKEAAAAAVGGDDGRAVAHAAGAFVATVPYEFPDADMMREHGGWPPLEVYFTEKRGCECGGHGMMFVSLVRAAGVPARRFLQPLLEPLSRADGQFALSSHMSAEFLDTQLGWLPVDCTAEPLTWGCFPLPPSADRPRHIHASSSPPDLATRERWNSLLEEARGGPAGAVVDLCGDGVLLERLPQE